MKEFFTTVSRIILNNIDPDLFSESEIQSSLERPQNADHGDIAFPCFVLAKKLKKAPVQIAKELEQKLVSSISSTEDLASCLATGPYLNFKLSPKALCKIVNQVLIEKDSFGNSTIGQSQKILIEYSSPNVAKELHIGHFRNTILGQSLTNIYRSQGYEVISLNHLGDWGAQFGKVAYGYLHYGNEEELKKSPLSYLMSLYIKVSAEAESNPQVEIESKNLSKKIEEKDPELIKLWKRFCELSINGLKLVYERLGVYFDHYIGESFYMDKVDSLIQSLKEKNLLEESDGAQVVFLKEGDPPCLILTREGTSLYATRDLAAAIWRKQEFQFNRCLYVVGSEQKLHLSQVFQVLEKMKYDWSSQLEHIAYGLYRFKDGKFSTRKGRVILAEEVLNEAVDKAKQIIEEKNPQLADKAKVAEIVGVGAVVFNDLSTERAKDVEFDWNRILDFEGDTGPYLQYSYARATSILQSDKVHGYVSKSPKPESTWIHEKATHELIKQIAFLESNLSASVRLNKPSIVANYAIDLAHRFSSFYQQIRILETNASKEDTEQKLGLVSAYRIVLEKTLHLLCMKVPEKM
ncbi:MAG: arginine--tRNA ligase [Oligoflexia bacterium]|nr:arginine--tRNA ligase [Oligoflexia bacterium]